MAFPTWGGKRQGAGRKPKGPKAGGSHNRRPALAARFPVHVTVRMLPHVWNLPLASLLRGDRQGRLRGAFLDAIPALFSTTSGQQ
jgi:hypothetical protein